MIPCQRDRFEIPDDVAYFNCAYTAPLLRSAAQAGKAALQAKSQPWSITARHFFENLEENRSLFGRLIGSAAENTAIIPAVSYGIALAAKNLPVRSGQTLLVLEEQFPSNVYSWRRLASQTGASVQTVGRPANGDWTSAVLEAIDRDTAIAALPNCHWTDGSLLDLVRIGERCREVEAALVVDATQSLGAMAFSVELVQPDFLVTTAHKWLLGPYSFGFCYVAPRWQTGLPLEENWLNRVGSEDFARLVDYRDDYQAGARRYDVGEASNFILAPVAAAALNQVLAWGVDEIAATLGTITDRIAQRAAELGLTTAPPGARAPHLIGVAISGGMPGELPGTLAREKVFVSVRGSSIRISPHLYNTSDDVDRLFTALHKVLS